MSLYDDALKLHKDSVGKLEVVTKVPMENGRDLSLAYSPGVAEPCRKIHENVDTVYDYTAKGNLVAVVSDGTAVLGLGDIGPEAAMPVMEGKACLFKAFAGVDAFPICVGTKDVDKIVELVKLLEPTFGGVNLEDIAAPKCFEIEERLKKETNIPIFHDDQHGTAICVLAAIYNSLKIVKKNISDIKVIVNGGGSAGIAITKILLSAGVKNLYICDKNGIINQNVPETMLNWAHEKIAQLTNPDKLTGNLSDALKGADVFIGVSLPGLVTKEMVQTMAKDPVVFGMANPDPEIFPDEAIAGGAKIVGTGRSDFPNQVNNVLAFPGLFRGALDVRASDINEEMKVAAAYAIANLIEENEVRADYVIPNPFDPRVAPAVAKAVAKAAMDSGVAKIMVDPEAVAERTRALVKR